jgi:hypothetical protein
MFYYFFSSILGEISHKLIKELFPYFFSSVFSEKRRKLLLCFKTIGITILGTISLAGWLLRGRTDML